VRDNSPQAARHTITMPGRSIQTMSGRFSFLGWSPTPQTRIASRSTSTPLIPRCEPARHPRLVRGQSRQASKDAPPPCPTRTHDAGPVQLPEPKPTHGPHPEVRACTSLPKYAERLAGKPRRTHHPLAQPALMTPARFSFLSRSPPTVLILRCEPEHPCQSMPKGSRASLEGRTTRLRNSGC